MMTSRLLRSIGIMSTDRAIGPSSTKWDTCWVLATSGPTAPARDSTSALWDEGEFAWERNGSDPNSYITIMNHGGGALFFSNPGVTYDPPGPTDPRRQVRFPRYYNFGQLRFADAAREMTENAQVIQDFRYHPNSTGIATLTAPLETNSNLGPLVDFQWPDVTDSHYRLQVGTTWGRRYFLDWTSLTVGYDDVDLTASAAWSPGAPFFATLWTEVTPASWTLRRYRFDTTHYLVDCSVEDPALVPAGFSSSSCSSDFCTWTVNPTTQTFKLDCDIQSNVINPPTTVNSGRWSRPPTLSRPRLYPDRYRHQVLPAAAGDVTHSRSGPGGNRLQRRPGLSPRRPRPATRWPRAAPSGDPWRSGRPRSPARSRRRPHPLPGRACSGSRARICDGGEGDGLIVLGLGQDEGYGRGGHDVLVSIKDAKVDKLVGEGGANILCTEDGTKDILWGSNDPGPTAPYTALYASQTYGFAPTNPSSDANTAISRPSRRLALRKLHLVPVPGTCAHEDLFSLPSAPPMSRLDPAGLLALVFAACQTEPPVTKDDEESVMVVETDTPADTDLHSDTDPQETIDTDDFIPEDTFTDRSDTAIWVPSPVPRKSVDVIWMTACAVAPDREIQCWGDPDYTAHGDASECEPYGQGGLPTGTYRLISTAPVCTSPRMVLVTPHRRLRQVTLDMSGMYEEPIPGLLRIRRWAAIDNGDGFLPVAPHRSRSICVRRRLLLARTGRLLAHARKVQGLLRRRGLRLRR